jgi:hypothetical protein
MAEKIRSAEISNALFVEKFDEIAREQNLPAAAQTAIKSAQDTAKQTAIKQAAYIDDKGFYQGVLLILGGVVILAVVGGLILTYFTMNVPEFITVLAATALGAVAGLLAPSPISK